jgi:hypothetical protein
MQESCTQTAKKTTSGKNRLWDVYQVADDLIRMEIILELKKANLFRHWQGVASKEGYDLPNAKAKLRDIFTRLLPETKKLFGLPPES